MFCADLDGWKGGWGGWEIQEEGDICTHTADSLCCMAEANTNCKQLYSNKKDIYMLSFFR